MPRPKGAPNAPLPRTHRDNAVLELHDLVAEQRGIVDDLTVMRRRAIATGQRAIAAIGHLASAQATEDELAARRLSGQSPPEPSDPGTAAAEVAAALGLAA